jgi:hypothetical protein
MRERNNMDTSDVSSAAAWGKWVDVNVGPCGDAHRNAVRFCVRVALVYLLVQLVAVCIACWALETEMTQQARQLWNTVCKQNNVPFQHSLVDCELIYARAFDGQHLAWTTSRLMPQLRQNIATALVGVISSPLGAIASAGLFYIVGGVCAWVGAHLCSLWTSIVNVDWCYPVREMKWQYDTGGFKHCCAKGEADKHLGACLSTNK